jgi:hypothetical protein
VTVDCQRLSPRDQDESDGEIQDADMDGTAATLRTVTSLRDLVFIAKPSPIPLTNNYGPVATVPSLPGRAFPFFDRMVMPDKSYLRTTFARHFLRHLGDSRTEWQEAYSNLRLHLENLEKSKEGSILSHLLYGVQLALDSQTRMYAVIQNDEYNGFVLLGAGWQLFNGREWIVPEEPKDLRTTLATFSTHSASLEVICRALSRIPIRGPGEVKEVVNPDNISTSKILWEELTKRDLSKEVKEKLEDHVGMLAFHRSYWSVNSETLRWALRMMTTESHVPIPEETPMYIPPSLQFLDDRIFQVLSVFGPDAPSFMNTSGLQYTIPPPSLVERDDPNEKSVAGHKELDCIIVALKSIMTAYHDARKMLKDRVIQMDKKERAKNHRCIVFKTDDRNAIYSTLKECVGRVQKSTGAEASGKRKRDDDDEGTRAAKKDFNSLLADLDL